MAALIDRSRTLTHGEALRLAAAQAAARDAAWVAAQAAAQVAAQAAARALMARDSLGGTFTQAQYDLLTGPWRTTIGPLHPDDAPIGATP